ncbi:RimK/LysX family protein [Marinobacter sp. CHS3-4]|uniref:putative ATP-dependent zinc protease n=1 Tax=Marinobacter sp. CHS3-4 TaxID=3045174 RepID=UPI0024B59EBD|nr:RimK/LysX family protein [Marinobacter sp. CHS3-4]MDI9245069.1 RimK/LysX family protein [Marinobacter sp. CHS3-4]
MSALVPSSFLKWATFLASVIFFSGCTSNQYFMVEKKDLNQLGDSVEAQGQSIASLEQKTVEQISALSEKNETSTQAILSALNEQAKRYSCPPAPAPAECKTASQTASNDARGRTNRLKGKVIVGELEKFYLAVPGLVYDARIDSGAETSSLDARNITRFERDGNNWVRFDVPKPGTGELITLEKEISRRVRIIQSTTDESERRVVVELQFMIGNHHQQAEFTLTNRQQMSHSVLVGRNILRDVMLIDVGKEYATELPSPLPNAGGSESP